MIGRGSLLATVFLAASGCIAPSVLATQDRAVPLSPGEREWSPASGADLAGLWVSTELSGPLALALRAVVYLFEPGGTYTGAALIEDADTHFEVLDGTWRLESDGLHLDDAPPARLEVAPDGSLRLSGEEGQVVLRRERAL